MDRIYEQPQRYLKTLGLALLLVLASAQSSFSNEHPLKFDHDTMTIEGRLDGRTTSFSRIVRVELTAGNDNEPKALTLLREDLRGEAGVINRSNVSPNPQTVSLKKGEPVEITVTVNNVTRPGRYTGNLLFSIPGSEPKPLQVVLDIKPKIEVRIIPSAFSASFTRCSPIPCNWINWLPPYLVGSERVLGQIDNQTPEQTDITAKGILLHGETPGSSIDISNLTLGLPDKLEALKPQDIKLSINERNNLEAGRYTGTIRISPEHADSITTNFTLDVRDGPLLALGFLVLGIIFGRVIKSMGTPEAQMQLKLWPRIRSLRARLDTIKDDGVHRWLSRQVADLERRVNDATETEQVLLQDLNAVSQRTEFFIKLQGLIAELADPKYEEIREKAIGILREARGKMLQGDADGAKKSVEQVESMMANAGGRAPSLEQPSAADLEVTQDQSPQPGRAARLVAWLAGTDSTSQGAEVRYRIWRPIMFLGLLIILILIGLETQYLSKYNFGVNGLFDYFSIFLWGISAEVINSTLQNLPGRRPV